MDLEGLNLETLFSPRNCKWATNCPSPLKKKRFEPSFALGLALKPSLVNQGIEIHQEDFVKYVAGETVQLSETLPNGWYQVLVAGNGLGFAKVTGNTLKNYFPKGLRFKVKN